MEKGGLGFEIEYTLNCVASVKMYGNVTVQANKQNDKTINNFAACFQEYYYRYFTCGLKCYCN